MNELEIEGEDIMSKNFFNWDKLGLIWGPSQQREWMHNSCLTPTPVFLKSKNIIRVFSSIRDKDGVGRIGYTDLNADNPTEVVNISMTPALDIGRLGAFDDNGVILGDFLIHNNNMYLYYVGFQLVQKAKFLAFTGCAISDKNAEHFTRLSDAPVLDRDSQSLYINAIHSIFYDERRQKIRAWTGSGDGWDFINGKPFPSYTIRCFDTEDLVTFTPTNVHGFDFNGDEYRIGRPRVYQTKQGYLMLYTKGTTSGEYICEMAESIDGFTWYRSRHGLGIDLSSSGWDSKHLCYPVLLRVHGEIYMFYNGNDMGKDGFGIARLTEGGDIFPETEPNLDKIWM